MKVMVIVKASKESEAGELPSEQLLTEMGNFNQQLADAGILLAGEGLRPSSDGVRVRFSGKERAVVDGPFAETKELIAGFWIWKVKSMEEAVEWVRRCPNPHEEESEVEIRPIFEADDFGEAFTPSLREQEAGIRAQELGLSRPRFETGQPLHIAGLNETYSFDTRGNIPSQWERFAPRIGSVPGQVGAVAYGVCWNYRPETGFDYLAGVEVQDADGLPPEYTRIDVPAGRYAVFTHSDHVSTLPKTIDTIWSQWVPDSGLKIAPTPSFERYTEEFDPGTGRGGMEVWVPIGQ
jgi:AraC family transcriptional regulator